MAKEGVNLYAFNRGLISSLALARKDVKRVALAASRSVNWMPRLLGSMMLRPGLIYTGTSYNNFAARHIPFVFSVSDKAIIEITDHLVRVKVSETPVTRASVTTSITNTTFDTDLTGWTDADEGTAVSVWVAGGYMGLTGDGTNYAIRKQTITSSNYGTEHALRIVVTKGPVILRVGSTDGGDEYISNTTLDVGTHSLAFTPSASAYIQLKNNSLYQAQVTECSIEAAGVMTITAPWAAADLSLIRYDESGDVLYISCKGYKPYKIERRGTNSWSVVNFAPDDGPFRNVNTTTTTITPSALTGSVTLTASKPFFKSTHVGALIKHLSNGQTVTANIAAENTFTDQIQVTGNGARRNIHVVVTGTWAGTIRAQRRFTSDGAWEDVPTQSFQLLSTASGSNNWDGTETVNTNRWVTDNNNTVDSAGRNTSSRGNRGEHSRGATDITDSRDGVLVYYRVGIKTGEYTSGTAVVTLSNDLSGIVGIARITAVSSSTVATADVVKSFGNITSSNNWWEGAWSDYRGYPSSVALSQGRLWWAGLDRVWGSASDDYETHSEEILGDSAPISKSIGSGPVDTICWLLNLQRLLVGGECGINVVQSNALDEPLTASNNNIRPISGSGSALVGAERLDLNGVFVQRGGNRLMEITFDPRYGYSQYSANDLCSIVPEIGSPGIIRIGVQRLPETRIHCVRSDGTVAILLFDKNEDLKCWLEFETNGTVEDLIILPGDSSEIEDKVYYHVNRTINGATVRYLERWAFESDCIGGTVNRNVDCALIYSGASTATITGLNHLEGQTVLAWGNGKDLGSYTVTSGSITLSEAVTGAAIGLTYTAQWQSTKLGTALNTKNKISHLGVILQDTHYQGLKYGRDFNNLYDLPLISGGTETAANTVHSSLDEDPFEFPGQWATDSRLCLQARAPRPCTILAATLPDEGYTNT